MSVAKIERQAIDTIRTLSMDAVQQANSGHPGTPMALAPVAYAIWNHSLQYDPAHPRWPARDRFVLSCGHASMLLYSVLHLCGVQKVGADGEPTGELAITLENIRKFRQWQSPCAGHPEFGEASGIEMTTGPLGQGIATSVGMAVAGKWTAATYDRPGYEMFGFRVYALCSDGDVMEGVGTEAASLAGHLGLNNLCWIYDDNRITIEGETELAFSEDIATKFRSLGWHVHLVEDANDLAALRTALDAFRTAVAKPTLIIVRSIIGFGSPNKANTHGAHGAPLGADEIKLTKQTYGWPTEPAFLVPAEVPSHFAAGIGARGARQFAQWRQQWEKYRREFPQPAHDLETMWNGHLPTGWEGELPTFPADPKGAATRVVSGKVLNALANRIPWLLGGSADLAPSTMTLLSAAGGRDLSAEHPGGRNVHFGIREHAMAAICNGLSLCHLRSFGATFFVFTDYMRPAMRLSALMHQPVIYVLTHDSIGLGEDGPTHQPVEHLAACRAIPGFLVMRPGDANEVSEAYRVALSQSRRPTALVLTRQNIPTLDRSRMAPATAVAHGGYVLLDAAGGKPDVILLGTGSELALCVAAHEQLTAEGIRSRVVSMPCCELFDEQEGTYRTSVLPPKVTARVAVEAGIRQSWDKYLGLQGKFVGMTRFGASAPYQQLYHEFGITVEAVVAAARAAVAEAK